MTVIEKQDTSTAVEEARRHLDECEAELVKHRADLDEAQTKVEALEQDASGVSEANFNKARSKADYLRAALGGKVKAVEDARGDLQRAVVEDTLQKVHGDAQGSWGLDRIRDARVALREASDALAWIVTEYNSGRREAIADLRTAGVTEDGADPFVATFATDHGELVVMGETIPEFAVWPDLCDIANESLREVGNGERLSLNTPGQPNQRIA